MGRTPCKVERNPQATSALTPGAILGVRYHVPMEHPHRGTLYRFGCDCDNRNRATAQGRRSAARSRSPCPSRGSRSSSRTRRAAHRRASGRATRRRAPRVCAARRPANASRRAAAPRAATRGIARRPGPPASAWARPAPPPRAAAAAAPQRPQPSGRNIGGRGGAKLAQPSQPSPRNNQARQHGPGGAATVGAAAAGAAAAAQSAHVGPNTAQQQNATQPNQLSRTAPAAARAASNARAFSGGVLRNQAFANLSAARDSGARALAGSTFQGRLFDPQWRRHRPFPVVIGWVGPLFWPYAYDDFYDGMFGAYAQGYGGTYAAVGP